MLNNKEVNNEHDVEVKMKDIREMFTQRDKFHLDATNTIASEISHAFKAIIEFLEQDVANVEWTAMDLNKDDDVIMFSANIHAKDDELTIITVAIPVDIVLQQSKEEVLGFLEKANREARAKQEEAESEARKNLTSKVKKAIEDNDDPVVTVPILKSSDDLTELTGADILREIESKKRTLH